MLSTEKKNAILERVSKIPIVDFMKLQIQSFDEGYCEMKAPKQHGYDGVFESFHGGLIMTVADSAACFAIFTMTGPDVRLTTTDMNIRFMAPCLTGVIAKARVLKLGRTLCPVTIDLFDEAGKHVAVAQVTYMLLAG